MSLDDEEVRLVAGALSDAGWHITTHGNEQKAHADLKAILQSLVDAKVEDAEDPPDLQPLEPGQAQKLFVKAIQKSCIAGNFTVTDNGLKDLHMVGSSVVHKMKVSPVTFRVTLEDLTEQSLCDLINLLRAAPSDLLE